MDVAASETFKSFAILNTALLFLINYKLLAYTVLKWALILYRYMLWFYHRALCAEDFATQYFTKC